PHQNFPYYLPPVLPETPLDASKFTFNTQLLSPKNPYGKLGEGCSHAVYRTRGPSGKIYYLKDLSRSEVYGLRDADTAQFIAHQEAFATWLMYQLFGPELIPEVFPVKFKDRWGLASSELTYFGTLHQLAQQLGFSEREIFYGDSALKIMNGKTYLLLPDGKEPIRVKGRIAFKVALHLLVAHYDIENSHKNIFMKLISDPLNYRQVACPGMFDFGCVFESEQMKNYIEACRDEDLKEALAKHLALQPVDAHIQELNVEDYDKITDRFLVKHAAFKRIADFPRDRVLDGLQWFQRNSPEEARSFIDEQIRTYLLSSFDLAERVCKEIDYMLVNENVETAQSLKVSSVSRPGF
ncbi:MAG TPA: hypothetical protein VLH77_03480, partial [Gammaproteobacteria bacterium]|nr:hypothetical protein [Gammaproteobacteria bacterium]